MTTPVTTNNTAGTPASGVTVSGASSGIVLEGPIAELREREIKLLVEAAEFVNKMGPDGGIDRQKLLDAANDLREMFLMVVVIGEFNAGKSTFVNALLGDTVLPMGITPTTDVIELIRYTPVATRRPEMRENDAIRQWGHPSTGLPGVVIVDTPGTGSVFQKHEQIAKSFLHRSDLVIFVISAKRAFADTERLYLELAKSYGKKIIAVINQIDLLDAKEQAEVKAFVRQQMDQMLSLRPPIFLVSAKKALQGDKPSGLLGALGAGKTDYGMDGVRSYLRETFEQIPPAKQKLLTQLELLRTITAKYRGTVQGKLGLIGSDTNAAEDLQREIEQQASGLDRQQESTLKEINTIFAAVQQRGEKFVDKHIRVVRASFRGIDSDALQKEFENDVIGDALTRIASTQEHYVNAIVDNGRAYWRGVVERLNKMEALLKEESATMDASTYADQRAALQSALSMADIEMKDYEGTRLIEDIQSNFAQNTRTFTYSAIGVGGGLIAFLLGVATPAAGAHVLAVAGVLLGPFAFLGGGTAALVIWRKAVADARNQLKKKIDELENSYRQSLVRMTSNERNRLLQYGKQILTPVFSQLQALAQRYKDQQAQIEAYGDRSRGIEAEINVVEMASKR